MASVDMAPLCLRCRARHWPDARHFGRLRRLVHRLRHR